MADLQKEKYSHSGYLRLIISAITFREYFYTHAAAPCHFALTMN